MSLIGEAKLSPSILASWAETHADKVMIGFEIEMGLKKENIANRLENFRPLGLDTEINKSLYSFYVESLEADIKAYGATAPILVRDMKDALEANKRALRSFGGELKTWAKDKLVQFEDQFYEWCLDHFNPGAATKHFMYDQGYSADAIRQMLASDDPTEQARARGFVSKAKQAFKAEIEKQWKASAGDYFRSFMHHVVRDDDAAVLRELLFVEPASLVMGSPEDSPSLRRFLNNKRYRVWGDLSGETGPFKHSKYHIPSSLRAYPDIELAAQFVADEVHRRLGLNFEIFSSYHQHTKTQDRWTIEPDNSIQVQDRMTEVGLEIVSPVMPLNTGLAMIQRLLPILEDIGGFTNKSTGLHINLSIDGTPMDQIDRLKFILFSPDQHTLDVFSRTTNKHTRSALVSLETNLWNIGEDRLRAILSLAKTAWEKAAAAILRNQVTLEKNATSIIIRNSKYAEVRSMGGDYFSKLPAILTATHGYAWALTVAADPFLLRDEYAKKIAKWMHTSTEINPRYTSLFAMVMTGRMSVENAKATLTAMKLAREKEVSMSTVRWFLEQFIAKYPIVKPLESLLEQPFVNSKDLIVHFRKIMNDIIKKNKDPEKVEQLNWLAVTIEHRLRNQNDISPIS